MTTVYGGPALDPSITYSTYIDGYTDVYGALAGDISMVDSAPTFTVSSGAPSTPPVLTAPSSSAVPVSISWTASDNASIYKLWRRSPAGSGAWSQPNESPNASPNVSGTSFSDFTVTAGTTYEYRVHACNDYGCSLDSNFASVSVVSGADTQSPSTPTNTTAIVSTSSLQISYFWSASTDNVGVAGYKIYRNGSYLTSSFSTSSSGTIYSYYYTDTGLAAGTLYTYTVAAYDAAGNNSPQTPSVSATTQSASNMPTAPSLSGYQYGGNGVSTNFTWSDNSTNETGFTLYTRPAGGTTWRRVTQSDFAANSTQMGITDYNITVGTHEYKLNAVNSYGSSTDSNIVSVAYTGTTFAATPSNLTATANGSNVNLTWTDNATNETHYSVYQLAADGSVVAQVGFNLAANTTSWVHSGVSAGTYKYRVNACSSTGCSLSSNQPAVTVGGGGGNTCPTVAVSSSPGSSVTGTRLSWTITNGTATTMNGVYIEAKIDNIPYWSLSWPVSGSAAASPYTTAFEYDLAPGAHTAQTTISNQTCGANTTNFTFSVSTSGGDTQAPSAPPAITASPNPGQVYLSWSASTDNAGVAGYKIFKNGGYVASSTSTSYYDYSVSAGATYSYYVKAYDTAGNESAQSATISATVPAGTVVASTTTSTAPNAPSNFTYSFSNSGATVNLSWQDNSTNENWFTIYQQWNGAWSTIGQVGTNATSFSDSPSAGTYYYQVSACGSTLCSPGVNLGPISVSGGITSPSSTPPPSTTSIVSPTAPISAFLKGVVSDSGQKPVQGVYVHVFTSDFTLNFSAITDANGAYGVSLPAGTYFVETSPPSTRSDLLKPAPQNFSIANGATITINLQFGAVSKIITGTAAFSNGQPITDAEVGVYSSVTNQWISTFTDGSGNYSLRVSGGSWQVGIRPRDAAAAKWSWAGNFPTAVFANDSTSETRTVNFTVAISDAKLTMRTVDQDGNVLGNAGIIVDVISAAQKPPEGSTLPPPLFRKSGGDGQASFVLKAGTYYVRAFLPPELGYFNPDEQTIILVTQQMKDVTLVFHKQTRVATITLKGKTKLDDGTPTGAYIWAWSEKGEATQLRSNTNGEFSFPATAGRWHIGAGKETNSIPYKSSEITIDVQKGSALVEIILSRLGQAILAPPITVSQPPTQQIVAQTQDGTKITIPDGAVRVSTPTINVKVKPTIEAPSQANAKVVSTVYDVSIKDAAGGAVTTLQKDIEITIPYKDEDLKDQGIMADGLVPSYYDESTGTWVKVDNYTIDKDKHVVIARVKHLTRFALVAAADIISPEAPANISVRKGAAGEVVISWTNPTSDFNHVKIYRSTVAGGLGKLVVNDVSGTSVSDTDTVSGTKYYYAVRAVDPAGNESTNAVQVSVTASGVFTGKTLLPSQATKLAILRKLTMGSNGDDVKTLQAALLKEGVYPEGLITGYFGKLTKQAVIRFQEKYTDEILKPNGLDYGTGIVGPSTRAKLNKLQ